VAKGTGGKEIGRRRNLRTAHAIAAIRPIPTQDAHQFRNSGLNKLRMSPRLHNPAGPTTLRSGPDGPRGEATSGEPR
jgi:hypothetical protein